MDYPSKILRGIPNKEFLDEYGNPHTSLFNFSRPSSDRNDNNIEESINWEDDEDAIRFTLEQKKDGRIQFSEGIAVMSRSEVDRLCIRMVVKNKLTYERKKLPENKYHGNLLLANDTPKKLKAKIAAGLALCVEEVIKSNT